MYYIRFEDGNYLTKNVNGKETPIQFKSHDEAYEEMLHLMYTGRNAYTERMY